MGTDCRCDCKNKIYREGTWRKSREIESECGTTRANERYNEKY